jgi:hypothetical protein
MKIRQRPEGQTVMETAFVLFVLMLIALGTVEFARAWYTKNSMKNAARHGARIAVVVDALTPTTTADVECSDTTGGDIPCGGFTCPIDIDPVNTTDVARAVCCSPGIHRDTTLSKDTTVRLIIRGDDGTPKGLALQGDSVTVCVKYPFDFVIGNSPSWPWSNQTFNSDATMSYEQ